MKNHIVASSLTLLVVVWAAPLLSAQAVEPTQSLPLRLAEPETKPLTGQQINDLISNHMVEIDDRYEPAAGIRVRVRYTGGCPPTEIFASDGRWQLAQCHLQSRIFKGRWMVEPFRGGHILCVEASDYPKECRFVWQGSSAGQIIMPLGTPAGVIRDTWFNPYRLVEWSGQMWAL